MSAEIVDIQRRRAAAEAKLEALFFSLWSRLTPEQQAIASAEIKKIADAARRRRRPGTVHVLKR
jgi:hypothetical protein